MNDRLSDVKFIVDTEKIPAHKIVLQTSSTHFRALFAVDSVKQSEIKLNVPLGAFKMILRYMYTGRMALNLMDINEIIKVYDLAVMYNLETLKEILPKYLTTKLSVENCFVIVNAADLYSLDDLKSNCLEFMDRRSAELLQHDGFNSMSSALLCTLLKRDTFYAQEIDIFHAVKNWSLNNSDADVKVNGFYS